MNTPICYIFGAGEFVPCNITLTESDLVIAADGGYDHLLQIGLRADVVIGDFDSVTSSEIWEDTVCEKLTYPPEKDDTDTEAAIREVIRRGCKRIHILGATGSRLDHVLANIGLLGLGVSCGVEILMADSCNRIRMVKNGISIRKEEQFGDYVSLLPVTPKVSGLTLKGMKYPLFQYEYSCFSSLGISNEIVGDEAEISFAEGILLVIESRDGE